MKDAKEVVKSSPSVANNAKKVGTVLQVYPNGKGIAVKSMEPEPALSLDEILMDESEKLTEKELDALKRSIVDNAENYRNTPSYLKRNDDFNVLCFFLNEEVAHCFPKDLFSKEKILRAMVTKNNDLFFKYIPNGDERQIIRMGFVFAKKYEK